MTNKGWFKAGTHWRPRRPWYDRDWLVSAYATKSTAEIAAEHGVTDGAIQFWLRKHQIPARDVSAARALKYWGAIGPKNPMYGKRGDINPNWKGGVTPARQSLYVSAEWRAAARAVKKRDSVCQLCGSDGRLEIHHIAPFSRAPLLATAVGNLIRLCESCHRKIHGKERRWSRRLYALVREQASRVASC